MKTIFAMILMMALYDASAVEIKVSKMSRSQGYDRRYDIKSNFGQKLTVDCQSFIQGVLIGPLGENAIMLPEWECEELVQDMKSSFNHLKKHCLEIDLEESLLVSQQTCQ
jgi:hypothetical protein